MSQDQALLILNHPKDGMFTQTGLTTDEATLTAAWFVNNHHPDKMDNLFILKSNLAKWLIENTGDRKTINRPWPWPLAIIYTHSEVVKRMGDLPNWILFLASQAEFYDVLGFDSKKEVLSFAMEKIKRFQGIAQRTSHGNFAFKLIAEDIPSYTIGHGIKIK